MQTDGNNRSDSSGSRRSQTSESVRHHQGGSHRYRSSAWSRVAAQRQTTAAHIAASSLSRTKRQCTYRWHEERLEAGRNVVSASCSVIVVVVVVSSVGCCCCCCWIVRQVLNFIRRAVRNLVNLPSPCVMDRMSGTHMPPQTTTNGVMVRICGGVLIRAILASGRRRHPL